MTVINIIKALISFKKLKYNTIRSSCIFDKLINKYYSYRNKCESFVLYNNKKDKKYSKSNLPIKYCEVCGRSFTWRKKWEKVWDDVKYCSERCRRNKRSVGNSDNIGTLEYSTSPISAQDSLRSTVKTSGMLFLTALSTQLLPSYQPLAANAMNLDGPTQEEIETLFGDVDDEYLLQPLRASDLRRLDESPDTAFYTEPRYVEHIDDNAAKALSDFHEKILANENNPNMNVLDLCSSWVSHVPNTISTANFVGLGMNMPELEKNQRLTSRIVQDLNADWKLPFKVNTFDVALLQLSIDYLIHPVEVMKELGRVLRPNGLLVITFSNRVFIDKAVAIWTGKSDLDHMDTVGRYIRLSDNFDPKSMKAFDVLRETRKYNNRKDPLYGVIARSLKR